MSELVQRSQALDYSHEKALHSSPLYIKLQPLNNQTNPTINLTSVYGPIQYVIPSKCCNLAESVIQFDVLVPAQTAYAVVAANMWTLFYRLTLIGQSTNTQLMDLSPIDRFASSLIPVATKDIDLDDQSTPFASALPSLVATSAALGQATPVGAVSKNTSVTNLDGASNDTYCPYNGIRKFWVSASNTIGYFTVSMKFETLPFNILSLNKMMYFGSEQLELNIYFNAVNRWCFNSTSQSAFGANPYNNTVGLSSATGSFVLNNIAIYLKTEQDADVISGLVNKAMTTGYSINFAYPIITRQNLSGSAQSINTQLTRGYGKSVLFIGTSWYNATTYATTGTAASGFISQAETNNTAQDHSLSTLTNSGTYLGVTNSANSYVTAMTYQSQIDSINILTNNQYNVFLGEHWLYNRDNMKHSAVKGIYDYNIEFVHLDNFTGKPICEIDQTVEDGLSLQDYRQHQLAFTATAGGAGAPALNWYVTYVTQRTLNISAQGMLVT